MSATKTFLMLTARAMQFERAGHGFGGLTPAIVARLLQGLPRGQFLMGMAAHARDFDSLKALEIELWREVATMAQRQRWPMERGEPYCRRFAGLAVLEAISARPLPCPACRGRGYTIVKGQGTECPHCESSGGRTLSGRTRAELTGVPWKTWRNGWDARYEAVHWIAVGWRSEALSHLAHGLSAMSE